MLGDSSDARFVSRTSTLAPIELITKLIADVTARAPTRIDLGGGWTDVPPYCDREGGFVCNVAISRYSVASVSQARPEGSPEADDPIIAAALRRAGMRDIRVTIRNDFPVGAGLGGSSAASAAVLGALAHFRDQPWERAAIAEEGRRIEVDELGVAGGRQDHYAATHGGALGLTFTETVDVRRIRLSDVVKEELVSRSTLIYTGESRVSGDTIKAVLDAYEAGERRVLDALRRMREIAQAMAAALDRADLDAVGALMAEHWVHQRALHPSIPTARIDEIVARAHRAGALGAKAMGASGGGCVLVIARADNGDRVRREVQSLGTIVDFGVDEDGLALVQSGIRS